MMPAEGVLKYEIEDVVSINTDESVAVLLITDGFIVRRAEAVFATGTRFSTTDAELNELFAAGDDVDMQMFRQAGNRASAGLFDDASDAIYELIEATADPDMADVLAAATRVLTGSRKQLEWDKLTAMVQGASEADRQKFMALVALIALSRG